MLIKNRVKSLLLTAFISVCLISFLLAPSVFAQNNTDKSILIANSIPTTQQSSVIKPSTSLKISIESLLNNFVKNGPQQLLEGVFVYLHDDQTQTFKVSRKENQQGKIIEQFVPQDEMRKPSERTLENQFCTMKNGWQYQFQAISSSFPFRVNNYYVELQSHYDFSLNDQKIVAGLPTIKLNVQSKDDYRYGYQLWFEPETAVLLKYKLIDEKGKTIEQYFFTDIKLIPSSIDNQNSNTEKNIDCAQQFTGLNKSLERFFKSDKLPKAYKPISYRNGLINKTNRQAHQFLFSDGLSTVSVFIEDQTDVAKKIDGVVKVGPMSVAGKPIDNHQVTVLGAIPVKGALQFLNSIKQ